MFVWFISIKPRFAMKFQLYQCNLFMIGGAIIKPQQSMSLTIWTCILVRTCAAKNMPNKNSPDDAEPKAVHPAARTCSTYKKTFDINGLQLERFPSNSSKCLLLKSYLKSSMNFILMTRQIFILQLGSTNNKTNSCTS